MAKTHPVVTYQKEVLEAVHYGVDGQNRFPVLSELVQCAAQRRKEEVLNITSFLHKFVGNTKQIYILKYKGTGTGTIVSCSPL